MREIREVEHLELYMGEFFDSDVNVIEEYQCNRLSIDRHTSHMGIHYINDLVHLVYATAYVNDKNKMSMIDALEKN